MTAPPPTLRYPRPVAPTPPRAGRGVRREIVAVLVVLLALVLRWATGRRGFDLFVDEFVYQSLGHSVRDGGLPRFFGGDVFFLHPPGFFYLEGLWERLTGPTAGLLPPIYRARLLNAVLAAATAGLLVLIVGRRSWRWGAAVGLLFAAEPFALRQNGRVLLETAVMAWVLLGLLLLLPLVADPTRRRRAVRAVGGGLCLGMGVFTKDTTVLFTILPVLAAPLVLGRGHLTWVWRTVAASSVPYLVFLGALLLSGHAGNWWQSKLSGLARVSGAEVTTGFRGPGAPSLSEQVLAQIGDFGGTYVLLAVGGLAALVLLRRGNPEERFLATVHLGAAFFLTYSLGFGTLEEQFLYVLLVPSLLTTGLLGARLADLVHLSGPWRLRGWEAGRVRAVLVVTLGLILLVDAATYARWSSRSDDGFARVRDYLAQNAAPGEGIIVVNGVSEFALRDYDVGPYTTPEQRREHRVRYLVAPMREIQLGYTYVSLPSVDELTAQGELVFRHRERTYGDMEVWRLPLPDPP